MFVVWVSLPPPPHLVGSGPTVLPKPWLDFCNWKSCFLYSQIKEYLLTFPLLGRHNWSLYVSSTVHFSASLQMYFQVDQVPSSAPMAVIIVWIQWEAFFFPLRELWIVLFLNDLYDIMYTWCKHSSVYILIWYVYVLPCYWQKVKALVSEKNVVLFPFRPYPNWRRYLFCFLYSFLM